VRTSQRILRDVGLLRQKSPGVNLGDLPTFVHNLIWMYQFMVASENLMVVAEKLATGRLKRYLRTHLEEERDHANWLADDLATVGVDVTRLPLDRSAVELAGTQYYLIHHVSPVCLLGYMATLEGLPFPVKLCDDLEAIHGKDLVRCLRYHAENDLEHRKELFEVIDEINDPLIYENAIRTQYLMDERFRADK